MIAHKNCAHVIIYFNPHLNDIFTVHQLNLHAITSNNLTPPQTPLTAITTTHTRSDPRQTPNRLILFHSIEHPHLGSHFDATSCYSSKFEKLTPILLVGAPQIEKCCETLAYLVP